MKPMPTAPELRKEVRFEQKVHMNFKGGREYSTSTYSIQEPRFQEPRSGLNFNSDLI